MVGDAAHRHVASLREGNIQDRRGLAGIVEEHLVEITETEEQEGPLRQVTPQGVILLHQRRSLGGHSVGDEAEG